MIRPGYEDITVYVDTSVYCQERIAFALAMAEANKAHLTGLCITGDILVPFYVGEIQLSAEILETQMKAEEDRVKTLEKMFHDCTKGASVPVAWRAVKGDMVDVAAFETRYTNIIIIGQDSDPDQKEKVDFSSKLPSKFFVNAYRPILVMPPHSTFDAMTQHIIIAWNGSREAMHAVDEAIPLMKKAKQVDIIVVDKHKTSLGPFEMGSQTRQNGYTPGARLKNYLLQRKIKAEVVTLTTEGESVAKRLLGYAQENAANLIVMGAYSHSLIREKLFGGTTQTILTHSKIPVFLAH